MHSTVWLVPMRSALSGVRLHNVWIGKQDSSQLDGLGPVGCCVVSLSFGCEL